MIGATSDESRAVREARFSIEEFPEGTETRPVSETCHGSRGIFVVVKKHQLRFNHSSRGCVEERLLLEMRIVALFSNALQVWLASRSFNLCHVVGTAAKSNTPEAIKTGQDTFGNSTLGSILLNSLPGALEALEKFEHCWSGPYTDRCNRCARRTKSLVR